ncbi:MAG: DNA polymerase III subunit delta' [Gammaproteobacteria bacterium]
MSTLLPWQISQWQHVLNLFQQKRLPHALLLAGASGVGKKQFAENISAILCCEAPTDQPCGQCHGCRLFQTNNHPDVLCVDVEEKSRAIKIDQVRELGEFIQKTPHTAQYKIVMLFQAEKMNIAAANALLKSLEEPAPNTLIILVSSQVGRLLPTLLSRCQRINFSAPEKTLALEWLDAQNAQGDLVLALQYAFGAPLLAKQYLEDDFVTFVQSLSDDIAQVKNQKQSAVAVAEAWAKHDVEQVLEGLFSLVDGDVDFYDKLLEAKRSYVSGVNLNAQMMFEALLI